MSLVCCIWSLFHKKFGLLTNTVNFSRLCLIRCVPKQPSLKGDLWENKFSACGQERPTFFLAHITKFLGDQLHVVKLLKRVQVGCISRVQGQTKGFQKSSC